jgi:cell division protein FtsW (lipid II flippase)
VYGQFVLYSASGGDWNAVVRGTIRLCIGALAMLVCAQIKPGQLRRLSPWLYLVGLVLLIIVDAIGYVGKGAQRWLDLGLFRFQPSEIMKLAVPMACAWYLRERALPPDGKTLLVLAVIILVPTLLTIVQPDLGTGLLILMSGGLVVLFAGLQAGTCCTTINDNACSPSSIRSPIRSARVTTSSSPRSRSVRAASPVRAICRVRKDNWSSCRNAPPISCSP